MPVQPPAPESGGSPEQQNAPPIRRGRGRVEKSTLLHNYRRSPLWTKEGEQKLLQAASQEIGRKVGDKELAELSERILGITRFQAARVFSGRIRELMVGPYLLYKLLGSGGQGLVFAASNTDADRFCALKVMPPEATQNEKAVRRMHAEAKMLELIDHPHVVKVHGSHEILKPQDLPQESVWIFSQTAEQIKGVTDRYIKAPPDTKAHPYYTQRDLTRRRVAAVLGGAGALLLTAGLGVVGWMLERREADRSTIAMSYRPSLDVAPREIRWDLRDSRFLETPEGAEVYELGEGQRLTLLPTTLTEGRREEMGVHSLLEGPTLRLVLRADGNARTATRSQGAERFTVDDEDTKIPQALGRNPDEVEKFLAELTEMKDPAFLERWLQSRMLWKFIDDISPHLKGNSRLQDDLERLREKLTVELNGFGAVCLMDCGRLPSPDPNFCMAMLLVDGAKMKQLEAMHGSPYRIDENTTYKLLMFLQFNDTSGELQDYWYLNPPILSATPREILPYTPRGKSITLSIPADDRGPLPLLRRFPVPTETAMMQPHAFRRAAGGDLRDPHDATREFTSNALSLLGFIPLKASRDYDPPNRLWNGKDIPTFRVWEQLLARAAVACGKLDPNDPKVKRMLHP